MHFKTTDRQKKNGIIVLQWREAPSETDARPDFDSNFNYATQHTLLLRLDSQFRFYTH